MSKILTKLNSGRLDPEYKKNLEAKKLELSEKKVWLSTDYKIDYFLNLELGLGA